MTLQEVTNRLTAIEEYKNEWELAHVLEDRLFKDVLVAIANDDSNAQELATEAIKSLEISFKRKCTK